MAHFYSVLDVFTDKVLTGNLLAVVFSADDILEQRMQAVAREFYLSETVFVLRPVDRVNTARVRIFTPMGELPFAGHPTIGTAVAVALQAEANLVNLEEGIGLVTCMVSRDGRQKATAKFPLPVLPQRLDIPFDPKKVAKALGLRTKEIAADNASPCAWSAGAPYLVVKVADRDALDRAAPNMAVWADVLPQDGIPVDAYLYCDQPVDASRSYATRMFAPTSGIPEDPVTGSAAAVLPAHLLAWGALKNGTSDLTLEQGVKMGRPSVIKLRVGVRAGILSQVEISGSAMLLASGTINI